LPDTDPSATSSRKNQAQQWMQDACRLLDPGRADSMHHGEADADLLGDALAAAAATPLRLYRHPSNPSLVVQTVTGHTFADGSTMELLHTHTEDHLHIFLPGGVDRMNLSPWGRAGERLFDRIGNLQLAKFPEQTYRQQVLDPSEEQASDHRWLDAIGVTRHPEWCMGYRCLQAATTQP